MADAKGSSAGGAGAGHGDLGRAIPQGQYQTFLASVQYRTAPSAANVHHQYPAGMIPAPAAMPVQVPVPRTPYSPQIFVPQPQSQPAPGSYQSYSPYGNTTSSQYQGGFADWRMYNDAIMSIARAATPFGGGGGSSSSSYGSHQNVSPSTNIWTNNYVPSNPYFTNYGGPATKDVLQAPSFHNNNHHEKDSAISYIVWKRNGETTTHVLLHSFWASCDAGFATNFRATAPVVPASPFQLMSPGSANCSSAQIFQEVNNLEDTSTAFGGNEIESDNSEELDPTLAPEIQNMNQSNGVIDAMSNTMVNCRDYRTVLRKDLTNSDCGNIGRIVLPKKDAEANLPPLVEIDSMILEMDDLMLPAVWKFKYRFWPNNKSRMYILETTGEFIKRHSLQAGDILIIYRNKRTSRYVARAVKAIQLSSTTEVMECECMKQGNSSEDCGFAVSAPTKKT
ncbi:putative B3 domain-containing protein Os04g0676650 [Phragmites australis]|uniref:putative B3 domain-containing protein Os04g0676650 n=1 Tax=Phragmites australis TaxID=29695 RepID=UPI002D76A739|nr:putative B3 domain-containing protein Os04g0676650 [Phragmites australis]